MPYGMLAQTPASPVAAVLLTYRFVKLSA